MERELMLLKEGSMDIDLLDKISTEISRTENIGLFNEILPVLERNLKRSKEDKSKLISSIYTFVGRSFPIVLMKAVRNHAKIYINRRLRLSNKGIDESHLIGIQKEGEHGELTIYSIFEHVITPEGLPYNYCFYYRITEYNGEGYNGEGDCELIYLYNYELKEYFDTRGISFPTFS